MNFVERLKNRFNAIKSDAQSKNGLIEPTEHEKKNGWTAETLSEYIAEMEADASMRIMGDRRKRPVVANSKFRKLK